MIKNCSVIVNNEAVTVVVFDGKEVQLPSIKREARKVFVKFENGIYEVVDSADGKVQDSQKHATTAASTPTTPVQQK